MKTEQKYYADQNFTNVPVSELISKEYAKSRMRLIDLKNASKVLIQAI